MRMYFVGGFLGSGKTTAIAGACRLLIARGERVGVVTNDQGKLQVDSLFMRAAGLPAVEVGGGCFCCRYDDFDERVSSLVLRERPDAVFAESVGSCADIIATVVKPFEAFRGRYGGRSVFSVFADSRLLFARLSGRRLPFSEDVLYVFDSQLEEADLLVLNKQDLLPEADRAGLRELAAAAWPGKETLEISGRDEEGAAAWLEALSVPKDRSDRESLDIDYERYGAGEGELSWLDERLVIEDLGGISSDGGRCRAAVIAFAFGMAKGLVAANLPVGHVKLQVSAPGYESKLSLTTGDFLASADLEALIVGQLQPFSARRVLVSLNARVQTSPEALGSLAAAAADAARLASDVSIKEEDRSAFRPGMPKPTHRMV
jgi:Ni2+-binding GTPase involved in maturation of urease and hydrogenase